VSSIEEGACDIYWNEKNLDTDHLDQEEAKEGRCCISSLSLSPFWITDSPFQVLLFSQNLLFSFTSYIIHLNSLDMLFIDLKGLS
jgi:hypothetical protein